MTNTVNNHNCDTIVFEFGVRGESVTDDNRPQLSTQVAALREILRDLDENPSYRAGIRGLTIRLLCLDGFSEEQEEQVVNAFRNLVLLTIEHLPDLKTFRWACLDDVMPIADEVVEALAAGKVEELFFPVTRIADSDLSRLRGLTTLSLGLPSHERTTKGYYHTHVDAFAEVQAQIVRVNASSVKDLAVTTSIRWECALPALRNATIVRLLNCSPAAMDRLLRTSPYLTSLVITGAEPADRMRTPLEVVFKALKSAPDALLQLTSFKLLTSPNDSGVTGAHEQILAAFLKNKTQLRRLHVTLSSGRRSFPFGRRVLEILPTLPSLEVLGVQLSCETLDTDELSFYDKHLPRDLNTLLVSIRFDKLAISPEEFHSLFTSRTRLKTLSLVPHTHFTFKTLNIALNPLLFDNRPPSLDFLEWVHCLPDRTRTLVAFCSGPERHSIFCPSSRGGRPFARKPLPNECGLEDWAWLREHDETNSICPDTGFELERCNYQGTAETAMDVDAAEGEKLGADDDDDDEIDRITEYIDIRKIEGICYETSPC